MTSPPSDRSAAVPRPAAAARRNLSQGTWDMLSGGSDSEATLRRNRMALDPVDYLPAR